MTDMLVQLDDAALVQQYVEDHSEAAFRELVRRYIPMVYATCRRQLQDAHLAEDVTQAVFVILARRATTLRSGSVLGAWLHRTAVYSCSNARQLKKTRNFHEQRVKPMQPEPTRDTAEWAEIEDLLDEGLMALNREQREVLLLRFFQNKTLAEVAHALDMTEYAVDKSLQQGLSRLRRFLSRHGVAISVGALGAFLSSRVVEAAQLVPAGLAWTVGSAALAAPSAGLAGPVAVLVQQGLRAALFSKLKAAVLTGCIAIFFSSLAFAVGLGLGGHRAGPSPTADAREADRRELLQLLERTGTALRVVDLAGLDQCATFMDREHRARWDAIMRVFAAHHRLASAAQERWGASAEGSLPMNLLGSRLDSALARLDRGSLHWNIEGERASLSFEYLPPDQGTMPGGTVHFCRIDGRWRIDAYQTVRPIIAGLDARGIPQEIGQLPVAQQAAVLAKLDHLTQGFEHLAAEVEQGGVADPAALAAGIAALETPAWAGIRAFYRLELRHDEQDRDRSARTLATGIAG